ncbi:MAG: HYR domain-containing protein [Saprospirales bacterium]|nr:HYR domain-containing protein [Saprospirales bacterium]
MIPNSTTQAIQTKNMNATSTNLLRNAGHFLMISLMVLGGLVWRSETALGQCNTPVYSMGVPVTDEATSFYAWEIEDGLSTAFCQSVGNPPGCVEVNNDGGASCCNGGSYDCLDLVFYLPLVNSLVDGCEGSVTWMNDQGNVDYSVTISSLGSLMADNVNCNGGIGNNTTFDLDFVVTGGDLMATLTLTPNMGAPTVTNLGEIEPGEAIIITLCKPGQLDLSNGGLSFNCCDAPETPVVMASPGIEICPGDQVTLTATGDLGSATDWVWYTGSCGGTEVFTGNPYVLTPPSGTTTYYVRGEGGCVDGLCGSVTITSADEVDPDITCPADEAVAAYCEYTLGDFTGDATVSDNCSDPGDIDVTQSPLPGTTLGAGDHIITLTAMDEAGNDASCTFTLTVAITDPTSQILARAWCDNGVDPAEEFQYYIEISGAAPGTVDYTISWDSDSENYTGGTIYIGPFNHSMIGGAVQVLDVVDNDNPACEGTMEVLEAVCGFPQSSAFCDCSLNDPVGSLPAGAILSQSEPGTFESGGTSGRVQKYILTALDGEILEVNMSGLFSGLENGDYIVYALNYRVEDAAIIENFLLPGQYYSVIEDGINGIGPLADVCYAVCNSVAAEYTVDCEDLNACNAMLMECPIAYDGNQAEFDLTEADDAVACGDGTGLNITYHISQMEATMGMNAIGSPYTSGAIDLWVRVEDGNGFFKLALLQLVVKESPALVMSGTDEPCAGNGGSATVTVVSGPAPYTYEWSSGEMEGPTAVNSHSILFVPAGSYTVSVTDGNGCLAVGEYTVNTNLVLADLSLVATGPQEAVCGDLVSVEISVDDFENIGTLQFSVNWDDTQLQLLSNTPLNTDGDAPVIGTPATDQLTYSWLDGDLTPYGAGLADGTTILTLNFKVLSNMASGVNVNITGIPTSIEASNGDFCPVAVTPFNLVDFDVDKITVTCPADLSVCLETPAFTLPDGAPAGGIFSGPAYLAISSTLKLPAPAYI